MAKRPPHNDSVGYISKKCHACYTYVPLEADTCPYCKVRLGPIDDHGMARKLTDWKAYVSFAVAFAVFLAFIIYAFF
jgi:hypothetical protein